MNDTEAARGLGWASIGIGLTEIAAPKQLERAMGIGDGQNTGVLRVLGVREIMHGVDILSHRDPTQGIWSRVGGDMLDNVLLGFVAKKTRNAAGFATICTLVLGIGIADMFLANRLSRKPKFVRRTGWF